MSILNIISRFLEGFKNRIELFVYRNQLPTLVRKIQEKDKITVLFVLSDLSLWKTESLYKAMLEHSRFEPIIGLTLLTCDIPSEIIKKYILLKTYIISKGYRYLELDGNLINHMKPDITFYQQPYESFISPTISYQQIVKNRGLICDVHYAFRTLAATNKNRWIIDLSLYRFCWQLYLENKLNKEYSNISIIKGKNMVISGVPLQDELMKPKEDFEDPWKPQEKKKKRIIYAPHHTLPDSNNLLNLSCFLDVCDHMIEIARNFSDKVQFAFKPHPFLKKKLIQLWGEEKTNKYYASWNDLPNGQVVEGSYIGLFKHSDAMMHDCDSFTIEYCYMKNPVLFFINPEHIDSRRNDLNRFGQKAFNLHTFGFYKKDIVAFVSSVVNGDDNKLIERNKFYESALLPPNGQSAVQNIINSILGK